MSLQLINYKCSHCGQYEMDVWADEDKPKCCDADMQRCLSKGGQSTFHLFRSYNVGRTTIDSKAAEQRLLAKSCAAGERPQDLRIIRDDPYKAKVHVDELKHKALKQNAHNPKVTKWLNSQPAPHWSK